MVPGTCNRSVGVNLVSGICSGSVGVNLQFLG